jgi:micrococcal nuclease
MKPLILAIAFLLVFSLACAGEYQAKVVRVVDGDTVDLAIDLGLGISIRERARFLDYDAPEMREPLGPVAKAFLVDLIEGKEIMVRVPEKKYRGALAGCW